MKWNFHSQNLNEKDGHRTGSMLRYGRAWLHSASWSNRLEWRFGWNLRASVAVCEGDDDYAVGLSLGLVFLTVYFSFGSRGLEARLRRWFRIPGYEGREVQLYVHHGALWWNLWTDPMSWSSTTPRWRHGCFRPMDFVFGRAIHSAVAIREQQVEIAMPEGVYMATVKFSTVRFDRPRWPLVKEFCRADIELAPPIPIPGKGENSWDCGEDALYAMSCGARDVAEAIGNVEASVMRSRLRYGGTLWRPAVKGAA